MIDRKYQNIVFGFLMALLMSGIMSMIITLYNFGIVDDVMIVWLKSWGFAFITAFPVALLVSPQVNALVKVIIKF